MACERSAPKYSGKGSSCFGVNSFCKIQVAACPKHRCLFDSAIAEETKHDCLCPRNGNNFPEGERFPTPCFLSRRILFLPLGETDDQNCCKYHLQQRHNPISHIPRGSAGKHRSHDVGAAVSFPLPTYNAASSYACWRNAAPLNYSGKRRRFLLPVHRESPINTAGESCD